MIDDFLALQACAHPFYLLLKLPPVPRSEIGFLCVCFEHIGSASWVSSLPHDFRQHQIDSATHRLYTNSNVVQRTDRNRTGNMNQRLHHTSCSEPILGLQNGSKVRNDNYWASTRVYSQRLRKPHTRLTSSAARGRLRLCGRSAGAGARSRRREVPLAEIGRVGRFVDVLDVEEEARAEDVLDRALRTGNILI